MNNLNYEKFREITDLHNQWYDRMEKFDAAGVDLYSDKLIVDTLKSLFWAAFPQLKGKIVAFELGGLTSNLSIYPLDAYDIFQWMWDENGYRENMNEIFQELNETDGTLYQEDVIEELKEEEQVNEDELRKLPHRPSNSLPLD